MAQEEARVTARVQVENLQQATQEFSRFTNSVTQSRQAMAKIGVGDEVRAAMTVRNLDRSRIDELLATAKSALAGIDRQIEQIFSKRSPAMMRYEQLMERGFTHETALRRTLASGLPGAGEIGALRILEPEARKLQNAIDRLEARRDALPDSLGSAQDKVFEKWMPRLGRMFQMALGLAGIGSALAILGQARQSAKEFEIFVANTGVGLGMRGGGAMLREGALAEAGAFGSYPIELAHLGSQLAGGFGRAGLERGRLGRFAGLGLGMGMDREGFARMAAEMSMTAFTPDRGGMLESERFGLMTLGAAEKSGLTRQQRQFYLESNRNLIELFTQFQGGKPLNVEDFGSHMERLRQAVADLGLVGGGLPALRGITEATARLVPIGQRTGDILRTGLLAGFSMDEALRAGNGDAEFGMTQLLARGVQPGNLPGFFRQMAGTALGREVRPGERLGDEELGDVGRYLRNILSPQLGGVLQTPGGREAIQAIMSSGGGPVSGLSEEGRIALTRLEEEFKRMKGGEFVSVDARFIASSIEGVGALILQLETTLKDYLGPNGAIVASILLSGILGATPLGVLAAAAIGGVGLGAYFFDKSRAGEATTAMLKQRQGKPLTDRERESLLTYGGDQMGIPGAGQGIGGYAVKDSDQNDSLIAALFRMLQEMLGRSSPLNDSLKDLTKTIQEKGKEVVSPQEARPMPHTKGKGPIK
jgi:hypothetical protein